MKTILTQDEYQNQFIDFYKQTLGTGIGTTVGPVDDDDEQDDGSTRPNIRDVGGGDVFNPMAGTSITGGLPYNATNIPASDYVQNNLKSAKKQMDKSFSGFKDYLFEQLQKPETPVLAVAGAMTGLPLNIIGPIVGEMNRKKQYENAVKIAATGGGNMMNLNGQTVSRVAGSKQYTGTLGNFTSEQIYALEELGKGYIPGTMLEVYSGDDSDGGDGTYTTTGKSGLLDAATAQSLGGNYDAYGNWHSTKYGTVSRSGPAKAAVALANTYGIQINPNDINAIKTFSTSWKDSARAGTRSTAGGIRGFFDNLRSNPLRDSTINQYKTQLEKTRANIINYSPGQQDESDGPQSGGTKISDSLAQKVEEQGTRDFFDDVYEDSNDSGGGTSFSGGDFGSGYSPGDYGGGGYMDDSGMAMVAMGGRIGMQAGGTAPAGFVQGPPGQFSEKETVADDQPMEVPEGTFVINAPAVEHAGSQDIRKMILDAYTVAREKGLDIGRVDRKLYESTVDVALSKGEVIVPPELAKIIGYDRLEKINNRGKKEVSRRQKASEGGFLGLANGGSVYDYEDPIILNEVNKGMQALLDEYAKRGVKIDTEPFDTDAEVRESQERARQINGEYISGSYTSDPLPETGGRPYVNVPRTPSLFNFFVMAEELHHLDAYKDSNQVVSPYDTSPMATVEMQYAEELRAKQKAYETVKGLLPKGKRTKEFTEDNYAKTFLFFLKQATPEDRYQKILADMTKKYPELARVSKQDEKASGGFINK